MVLTREVSSDREVQEHLGNSAMRKVQILRMTEEAYDQGGVPLQNSIRRRMVSCPLHSASLSSKRSEIQSGFLVREEGRVGRFWFEE